MEIFQREKGANFRGFLVQALDASTHSPVGHFLPAQGMKPMSECSSGKQFCVNEFPKLCNFNKSQKIFFFSQVTHSDSRPKKAVIN